MALVYTFTRIACSNGLDLDTPKAEKLPYVKRTQTYVSRQVNITLGEKITHAVGIILLTSVAVAGVVVGLL